MPVLIAAPVKSAPAPNVASNSGNGSYSWLEKYHTKKALSQSEIDYLTSQGIPTPPDITDGGRPPYSLNGIAISNYIGFNHRLVMVGDEVDPFGNYDIAAHGYVNMYGAASLHHVMQGGYND